MMPAWIAIAGGGLICPMAGPNMRKTVAARPMRYPFSDESLGAIIHEVTASRGFLVIAGTTAPSAG